MKKEINMFLIMMIITFISFFIVLYKGVKQERIKENKGEVHGLYKI